MARRLTISSCYVGKGHNAPGVIRVMKNQKEQTMEKKDTIAGTMKAFMESGPSVTEFTSYKALNDAVGAVHGLAAGKCQALAGEKAWAWHADADTGTWRKATPEEVEAKRASAAGKNHGVRAPKVMSPEDRAALDAQVAALETVANPALAPLLADLRGKQAADDAARRGSLKDRLQTAIDALGMAEVVAILEAELNRPQSIDETITEVEKAIEERAENA